MKLKNLICATLFAFMTFSMMLQANPAKKESFFIEKTYFDMSQLEVVDNNFHVFLNNEFMIIDAIFCDFNGTYAAKIYYYCDICKSYSTSKKCPNPLCPAYGL